MSDQPKQFTQQELDVMRQKELKRLRKDIEYFKTKADFYEEYLRMYELGEQWMALQQRIVASNKVEILPEQKTNDNSLESTSE